MSSSSSQQLSTNPRLTESHQMYCDYGQKERSDCALMSTLGHPGAELYKTLRAFFDTLKYAANYATRRVSYADETECSQFSAPELGLSWYPSGPELSQWGHVYPAQENWEEYIQAAAKAGWPSGAEPSFSSGTWRIRTKSDSFVDELYALRELLENPTHILGGYTAENAREVTISIPDITEPNIATVLDGVLAAVRKYHEGCLLPLRDAGQDEVDSSPLPLAQKVFMVSNVKELTVTERHVLVPLVPLVGGEDFKLMLTNQLSRLFDEGYPFFQAEQWLSQMLTPASFASVKARYEHTSRP